MSPEPNQAEHGSEPDPGVFGSLPRSRPSIRSPRRDAARTRAQSAAGATGPVGEPAAEPRSEESPGPPRERGATADLEGLARAGVGAAAQTAAVGLRVAGRLAGALREAVERR